MLKYLSIAALCLLGLLPPAASETGATASARGPELAQGDLAGPAQVIPEQWDTRSTQMQINGNTHELLLRYIPGDEAWADRVAAFVPQAIPMLEQVIGAPYPGPPVLRVSEKGGEQLYGAAGLAACNESMCGLAVEPAFYDQVLLHEIGHVWTHAFDNRWLAEGTAEFAAIEAANRLRLRVIDSPTANGRPPSYPLDLWGHPINFLDAGQDALLREYEGYDRSTRLLQIIQARNGAALQSAYATLVEGSQMTVTSERFMDALEDAGGGNLDDLFSGWVFAPGKDSLVVERRAARDSLASLNARLAAEAPDLGATISGSAGQLINEWKFAEATAAIGAAHIGIDAYLQVRDRLAIFRTSVQEAGLGYPVLYEQALENLQFGPIAESIAQAEEALTVYVKARDTVLAPRTNKQKIGLLRKDPEGQLKRAETDFEWGRFEQSITNSHAAEATLNGAAGDAARNVLIAAGLLVGALLAAVIAFRWALRGGAEPAGSSA